VSVRYQLTLEAQEHVDQIGAYIARDSVDAALKIYDALEEAFGLLAKSPGIGHSRQDLTSRPVKFWSVYSYLVVYDPESRPVTIIAVLHGARDIEHLLKRT
jgi:toxin ParE1/3/4